MGNVNRRIMVTMTLGIGALLLCLIGVVRLAFFQKGKYSGDESLYPTYTREQFERLSSEQQKNCNCIVVENVKKFVG